MRCTRCGGPHVKRRPIDGYDFTITCSTCGASYIERNPNPNRSRTTARSYSSVEWAIILDAMETAVGDDDGSGDPPAEMRIIAGLREHVTACAAIEVKGCGLDHPDNAHLVPPKAEEG